ncbi:hypothetical protein FACUT_5068 [Fusarium acutatum]|uniref:Uncharacterized protein n=1 Tax=Fusarium acutatum TaxID=78861 RepID=A0A8H4JWI2_9HYPO|nr:hypothetical protein FACUT_5068 [Fusarium acutatum]
MGSYYANSLCCIAASSAKDSSEGILSERRVARYGKWYTPSNVFLESPYASGKRVPSSLLERGWCLQEWVLSPGILHWTANGLVWECLHGFFWEGQTGFEGEPPVSFEEVTGYGTRATNDCILDIGSQQQHEYVPKILLVEEQEALGVGWTALVAHYTDMDLSFPSDRLAAIQGIASLLSERHGVDILRGFSSHTVFHICFGGQEARRGYQIAVATFQLGLGSRQRVKFSLA